MRKTALCLERILLCIKDGLNGGFDTPFGNNNWPYATLGPSSRIAPSNRQVHALLLAHKAKPRLPREGIPDKGTARVSLYRPERTKIFRAACRSRSQYHPPQASEIVKSMHL